MARLIGDIALVIMGLAALGALAGLVLFHDSGKHRRK